MKEWLSCTFRRFQMALCGQRTCIQVAGERVLWSGHMGSALPELFSSEVMVCGRLG